MVALAKWELKQADHEAAKKRAEEEAEYRRTHKKREIRPLIPVIEEDSMTSKTEDADRISSVSAMAEVAAHPATSMPQSPCLSRQDDPPAQDGNSAECIMKTEPQESETFDLTNRVRVGQQSLI